MEAFALGAALCERLAASRAPFYDPTAVRELSSLRDRIEAIALDVEASALTGEAAGRPEEAARARAAAEALRLRLEAALSVL